MNENVFGKHNLSIPDTETYVCLDVETTGLVVGTDLVIEIGAIKFKGKETLDTFHTLVNPGISLPYFVSRLTGIKQQELNRAPALSDIAEKLIAFVGNYTLVGQSLKFDLGFLSAQGLAFPNNVYDTLEMAKIVLPQLSDFSLASIASYLDIHQETAHRAFQDAEVTRDIFLALLGKIEQLDQHLIQAIVQITQNSSWPLYPIFSGLVKPVINNTAINKENVALSAIVSEAKDRELGRREDIIPLDVKKVIAFLSDSGRLAKNLPSFEYRESQIKMAEAVTMSLNNSEHLIVEAGTGTGKSVAYLLPALLFAYANDINVVVSTNTINLQEQLISKDIPLLLDILELSDKVKIAALKGRSNYLCLRRWDTFRQKTSLLNEEIGLIVRLMVWLGQSGTGDRSELNLNWGETPIWEQICARSDNCLAEEQCSYHRQGQCFLYRARQNALAAHIIVANHALLISDLMTEGKLMPPYDYLIVDEAHHLEEVVTEQIGFRVSQYTVFNHLNHLVHKTNEGLSGLVPELEKLTKTIFIKQDERKQIEQESHYIEQQVDSTRIVVSDFFEHIFHFVRQNIKRQTSYENRLRLTPVVRQDLNDDGTVMTAWSNLNSAFVSLGLSLRQVHDTLQNIDGSQMDDSSNLMSKLESAMQENAELCEQISLAIAKPEADMIYWLSTREGNNNNGTVSVPLSENVMEGKNVSVCAAPLHIGTMLDEKLFSNKNSVILTGATLSIENSFDYIKERLGLSEVKELQLGCPFDYQSAALIYLPSDIPGPTSPGYNQAVGRSLIDLCRASKGHALILFTSHAALRSIYSIIKTPLEDDDILVVGQGINGSARNVLGTLKSNPQTVVLGTNALWEGVDVAADSLNLLVITRLPFNVPDDPIHQARAELFDDGFRQYTLPQAIIKFKQGFGRLIRRRTDHGMIVILDQRLQSKYYGDAFIQSLPPCNIKSGYLREMPREVVNWL